MDKHYPHLLATVAPYLSRSDHERIEFIRKPRWINYTKASQIISKLEELLEYPKSHRMPNLLLVGDTNNGKTMLVDRFFKKHLPDDHPDGDSTIVPVLYVQAPPVPDEGRFYNAILEALFAPYKPSDRPDRKQFQAMKLMRAVGVKMLIVDEIHHLLAGNSAKQREFLNVIKYLGNELEVPIVGVGTRDAFRAIQTDPQLSNRFEPMTLPRWAYDEEFLSLLATFEKILPLKKPSNLIGEMLSERLFGMTEGYLGELCRLIVMAAIQAVKNGAEQIDKKLLEELAWISPAERRKEPRD